MTKGITAILLAAGQSRRMGQPKLLLPWGDTTVLGQVVSMFSAGLSSKTNQRFEPINEILVVTGGGGALVEAEAARLAVRFPIRAVNNPNHVLGGMLSSIQAGLAALAPGTRAALIGLGDQPQVLEKTVRHICAAFDKTGSAIIIPSFQGRRGHPWLVAKPLWQEIMALPPTTTPREFLETHTGQIEYVTADQSILQDIDTPEDYNHQRP